MREILYFIFWYFIFWWDFTYVSNSDNGKTTKYFYFKYKGIVWAILGNGYSITIDWGNVENTELENIK